jgi:hypothetical protein
MGCILQVTVFGVGAPKTNTNESITTALQSEGTFADFTGCGRQATLQRE